MTSTIFTSVIRRSVSFRHGDHRSTRYNMAKAGFYYTGDDLVAKCCACKSIVTEFRKGDDPFGATAHHSNCPFNIREMENYAAVASSSVRRSNDSVGTGGFVSDTNNTSSNLPTTAPNTVANLSESHTVIDKAKLMKENEQLRSAKTCKKCKQMGVETLFLPCRHLVTCEKCASNMENCVTCNAKILQTVRTYVM